MKFGINYIIEDIHGDLKIGKSSHDPNTETSAFTSTLKTARRWVKKGNVVAIIVHSTTQAAYGWEKAIHGGLETVQIDTEWFQGGGLAETMTQNYMNCSFELTEEGIQKALKFAKRLAFRTLGK